ncbi:MAG: hypothetical protein WBC47_10110, partial [Dehalococcoidia bacterium]
DMSYEPILALDLLPFNSPGAIASALVPCHRERNKAIAQWIPAFAEPAPCSTGGMTEKTLDVQTRCHPRASGDPETS